MTDNALHSAGKAAWSARAPETVFTEHRGGARYGQPADVFAVGLLGLQIQGTVDASALPYDTPSYHKFLLGVFGPMKEGDAKRNRW